MVIDSSFSYAKALLGGPDTKLQGTPNIDAVNHRNVSGQYIQLKLAFAN